MKLDYQQHYETHGSTMTFEENHPVRLIESTKEEYEKHIQYLRDVIDNLPGSIYWKNTEGVYLGNNRFARQKMLSLGLSDSVLGKTDYDLFDKNVADEFRKNDLLVMNNNNVWSSEEVTILENGEEITQLSTKKPLHDEQGKIIGIVGNTIDITELKAKEKAEENDFIKTQFIQNMEHDIRTPFTGIWALASRLLKIETDLYKKELLEAVVNCSKELLDYCNGIIDLIRVENRPKPMVAKKFNLYRLIQATIDMELPAALAKGILLLFDYPQELQKIWISDPYRLKRILINLISNAVKFTKKGHVKIYLKTANQEKETENKENKTLIRIYIEDTGIGIPQDKQLYIYEKFYRATPSNKGLYQGIGLGLSAVKQLIQEMEGELECKSTINKGSTFLCTIPMSLPLVNDILEEE